MQTRLHVVVVDDDASVCKALSRLLRTSQMDVRTHTSAESFLNALEHRQPDCLILDIRMPGMSGPDLRQHLLDAGYRIPIIFITAYAEDALANSSTEHVETLRKPFDNQTLLDAIDRAIQRDGSD